MCVCGLSQRIVLSEACGDSVQPADFLAFSKQILVQIVGMKSVNHDVRQTWDLWRLLLVSAAEALVQSWSGPELVWVLGVWLS